MIYRKEPVMFLSKKNWVVVFLLSSSFFQIKPATEVEQQALEISRWDQLLQEHKVGTLNNEIKIRRNNMPPHLLAWLKKTTRKNQHPIIIFRTIDHYARRGNLSENDLKVIATLAIIFDIRACQDARCFKGSPKEHQQAQVTFYDLTEEIISRFSNLKTLSQTRAPVIEEYKQAYESIKNWQEFFEMQYEELPVRHPGFSAQDEDPNQAENLTSKQTDAIENQGIVTGLFKYLGL